MQGAHAVRTDVVQLDEVLDHLVHQHSVHVELQLLVSGGVFEDVDDTPHVHCRHHKAL